MSFLAVAIALLIDQLTANLEKDAPDLFLIDVQADQREPVAELLNGGCDIKSIDPVLEQRQFIQHDSLDLGHFRLPVVKILVENAQPVEFGQKLFLVEPA